MDLVILSKIVLCVGLKEKQDKVLMYLVTFPAVEQDSVMVNHSRKVQCLDLSCTKKERKKTKSITAFSISLAMKPANTFGSKHIESGVTDLQATDKPACACVGRL